MSVEYELTIRDYLGVVRRHSFYVIATFVLVLITSIVVAIAIPPVYQSVGTIMIESQQIPTDFVKDSVNSFADERIQVVKQRVMTRENLIKIIDKHQLFSEKKSSKSLTDIVELTKAAIGVTLISADVSQGQGRKSTIAFQISFDYKSPDVAHNVASELVTLFLAENIKSRTERATETTDFLEKEAARQKEELEKIELKVADYKRQHSNALPENADMHMSILQRDEQALRETERDIKTADEELRYLDIELTSAKAGVGFAKSPESVQVVKSPAEELEGLKAEYTKLSATYNDEHPTLRALKRKIEKLENSLSTTANVDTKAQTATLGSKDLIVAKVQAQIDSAKSRRESLVHQQQSLRASLAQMESSVSQTPQVQLGLTSLLRDYDSAKTKYTEMLSKVDTAKVSENLEQENKAERFTVLEPPEFPERPTKPNRKKIIGIGFAAGLGLGLGLAMVLETIDGKLRGAEAIAAHFNMKPLVVVPYMKLGDEVARRRKMLKYSLIAILVFSLLAIYVVHVFVMPLDILISKISTRFS
jgi:polysaccharide chain length determinant protein (PEP-CTERM system associated)